MTLRTMMVVSALLVLVGCGGADTSGSPSSNTNGNTSSGYASGYLVQDCTCYQDTSGTASDYRWSNVCASGKELSQPCSMGPTTCPAPMSGLTDYRVRWVCQ